MSVPLAGATRCLVAAPSASSPSGAPAAVQQAHHAATSDAGLAKLSRNLHAVAVPQLALEFLDLRSLVERLREELPTRPSKGAPIDGAVVARVTEFLQQTKINPREWRQHAVFRRGRYTRNIVGYSPGQFIALLLCWERGQQSPVHDHTGAHCFVKMMSGKLCEQRFAWSERGGAEPGAISEATLDAARAEGSVGFMHDALGLHRIINPSNDEVAVSLHIYSPPFQECQVFPPTGGAPRIAPMVSINAPLPGTPEAMTQPVETVQSLQSRFDPTLLSLTDLCFNLGELANCSAEKAKAPDPFTVMDLVTQVELAPMEWVSCASAAHFSEFGCVQHLVHCDDQFSVIVSCWSPGQSVPPHTLGRGRQMWIKVLHGTVRYQDYSPGMFPWEADVEHESMLAEGSCSSVEECGNRMRSLANASDTDPAVTVQIFSPPLTQFTYQTDSGPQRRDVPALLGFGWQAPSKEQTPSGASMRGMVHTAGRRYLSFRNLSSLLDEEFARPDPSDAAITGLLRKAVFNTEEWRSLLSSAVAPPRHNGESPGPRSVILAQRRSYTLLLRFWGYGHGHTAIHEQQSLRSWTLVLEGELEEQAFGDEQGQQLLRLSTLKEESLTFLDGHGWVLRSAYSDVPCVSLHLYRPAMSSDGLSA